MLLFEVMKTVLTLIIGLCFAQLAFGQEYASPITGTLTMPNGKDVIFYGGQSGYMTILRVLLAHERNLGEKDDGAILKPILKVMSTATGDSLEVEQILSLEKLVNDQIKRKDLPPFLSETLRICQFTMADLRKRREDEEKRKK